MKITDVRVRALTTSTRTKWGHVPNDWTFVEIAAGIAHVIVVGEQGRDGLGDALQHRAFHAAEKAACKAEAAANVRTRRSVRAALPCARREPLGVALPRGGAGSVIQCPVGARALQPAENQGTLARPNRTASLLKGD